MAYIDIVEPEDATGVLKEIYDKLKQSRGKLAQIHKIQSLHPESIVKHMDLYMTLMFGQSPLSRLQREMLGVVVSAINGCTYCQLHHGEALNHYWKDEQKVKQLRSDFRQVKLSEEDHVLCELAEELTVKPDSVRSMGILRC